MKKKLALLLCIFVLCLVAVIPAWAAGELVVDSADILTAEQESQLLEKLEGLKSKYDMDFVVVTTDSIGFKTMTEYADDYYDQNGYSQDGILMLVNMDPDNRGYIYSTAGKGITYFTDYGLYELEDNVYPYMVSGDYAGAFNRFADDADRMASEGAAGKPYDNYEPEQPDYTPGNNARQFKPMSIVIALIGGAIIALIIVSAMKSGHRSVAARTEAADYVVPGSLNITGSRDTFLYHNVVAAPIPQSNNNNFNRPGGGGGFSGGGSSIHISSGGVSHGGSGGRSF